MQKAAPPRFAVPILFAVVFIDLVGFGLLVPLIPFYVERLGAGPEIITLVIAVHPLAQSVSAPFWGGLSDRIGRRPVLLVSMLGHAVSYVMLGYADSLAALVAARVMSGVTSANIATAYAYIADVTTPAERAAAMGRISAAFGMGFAIGPAIGGLLAGGDGIESANFLRPALAAAGFSLLAFVAILIFLPETRPAAPAGAVRQTGLGGVARITEIARRPIITLMIVLGVTVIMWMAVRESIFPLWLNHRFGLNAREIGLLVGYSGALLTVIQLVFIGGLARRFGEANLVRAAVLLLLAGWSLQVAAGGLAVLVAGMTLSTAGSAFFQTSMQSLLSRRAGADERGTVLSIYQSSNSLARFAGQAGSGTIYGQVGINAPFVIGAVFMVPAFFIATRIARAMRPRR